MSASAIDPAGVALVHTIFNIVTTAMLLPFTKLLEKLAYTLVRDSKKEKEAKEKHAMLDERLLATPAVAIEVCHGVTIEMGKLVQKNHGACHRTCCSSMTRTLRNRSRKTKTASTNTRTN